MLAALRVALGQSADEELVGGLLPDEGEVPVATSTISASARKDEASVVAGVETRPSAAVVASFMATA